MPTPSTVSMMSNDDRWFVDEQVILAATATDAQCYSCDEFSHYAQDCPKKILSSGTPSQVLFQAMIHQHTKGQITIHPIWAQAWETFQPITITLLFPPQQEQQQIQAHIMLPIQPPLQLVLPFSQWMPPLPLMP